MKTAVVCLLLCIGLSACGQKGPLYLPQPAKPQPEAPQATEQTPQQDEPVHQDREPEPASADPT